MGLGDLLLTPARPPYGPSRPQPPPYVLAPLAMGSERDTPLAMPKNAADREIDQLFEELDQLLKNPDIAEVLAGRGVNTSLAMLAADGLRAYLKGNKDQAAEDLATVADEISSRMAMAEAEGTKGAGEPG